MVRGKICSECDTISVAPYLVSFVEIVSRTLYEVTQILKLIEIE